MPFIPHTEPEVRDMLAAIGVPDIESLFDEIPRELRIEDISGMPAGMPEMAIARLMTERAEADGRYLNFIGAGAYEHHIPAAVWQIATRGEFYSAYTPYQAEASQGTLQVLYEFQTMMASLTGLDVSNASLYDGASALAEAVLMAVRCAWQVAPGADAAHGSSPVPQGRAHYHPQPARGHRRTRVFARLWRHARGNGCRARRRFRSAGDSAAERLRRAGGRGRAHRLGARKRSPCDRRRQPAVACAAEAAR